MAGIKCCFNCDERHLGCHADCERYLIEKEEIAKWSRDKAAASNARVIYNKTRFNKSFGNGKKK